MSEIEGEMHDGWAGRNAALDWHVDKASFYEGAAWVQRRRAAKERDKLKRVESALSIAVDLLCRVPELADEYHKRAGDGK